MFFNITCLLPRKSRFLDTGTQRPSRNPYPRSSTTRCPICCVQFTPRTHRLRINLCGHVVCKMCLAVWLDSFKTCPTCARQVYCGPLDQHSLIEGLRWQDEAEHPEREAERAIEAQLQLPEKTVFQELGLQHYKDHVFADLGRASLDTADCAICLEPLFPDCLHHIKVIKACGHLFHDICLGTWLKERKTCPVCRGKLFIQERKRMVVEEIIYNSYFLPNVGDTRERPSMDMLMSVLVKARVQAYRERHGQGFDSGEDQDGGDTVGREQAGDEVRDGGEAHQYHMSL